MKEPLTIGIVGGMSPESTVSYYHHIVHRHQNECGDHGYPRMVISSVSFQQYIDWQHAGDWKSVARGLEQEFRALALAGASFALIAANTMHKVLPDIRCDIPILKVFDAVAAVAKEKKLKTFGLTGTKFTMSDGFYSQELEKRGLSVLLPSSADQETIHEVIFKELISGRIVPQSVKKFEAMMQGLLSRGADAVLLACTELEMLTRDEEFSIPTVDTARIHAEMAWSVAVQREPLPARNR